MNYFEECVMKGTWEFRLGDEARYEDHSVNWRPANGWFQPFDIRQAAYWALFAGAHGHTFGCRGVWQMFSEAKEFK
ncbi:MAG: DUF4038 domain-containing protein [Opitutaceae bacterium]